MAAAQCFCGWETSKPQQKQGGCGGKPSCSGGLQGGHLPPGNLPLPTRKAPLTWPEPQVPSKAPQRHFIYCIFMKQPSFVPCERKGPSWGTKARQERVIQSTSAVLLHAFLWIQFRVRPQGMQARIDQHR